jgi:hypothetical protein
MEERISERREKLAIYQKQIAQKDEQITQLQTGHKHTTAMLTDLQAAHQALRTAM